MKKGKLSVWLCGLLAALIVVTSMITLPTAGRSGSVPTLFVNDEPWYNESVMGWRMVDRVCYIPIMVFTRIPGVRISYMLEAESTLISYREKYLSIDSRSLAYAYTEEAGSFPFKTYYFGDDPSFRSLYVPAASLCGYLGLYFEMNRDSTAVRIYDGTASMTMEEVLRQYSPSLIRDTTTGQQTTVPPETLLPETTKDSETRPPETTSPPLKLKAQTVFLLFDTVSGEGTEAILSCLASYGVPAAFFLSSSDLTDCQETVRRLAADGYAVGIGLSDWSDDAVLSGLGEVNDRLYHLTKRKSRLVLMPDFRQEQDGKLAGLLENAGFRLCTGTFDTGAIKASLLMTQVKKTMEAEAEPVFRFPCTKQTADFLPSFLSLLAQYRDQVEIRTWRGF